MKPRFPISIIVVLFFAIFSCKKENSPPIISNQSFEVAENSPEGSIVGNIVASDPDGNQLTFEIISNEEIPFDIEAFTNRLVVKKGMSPDYEAKSKYIFIIKVTDSNKQALFNLATVTVDIKNIIELPMDGMIAYYPFNSDATDESKNSYDGIVMGSALTTDRKGNANSAYSFDGISNYINLNSLVGNGIRSISLWFRLDMNIDGSLGNIVTLLAREGDYNNISEFSLAFMPNGLGVVGTPGKLRFIYTINTSNYFIVESNSASWQKDKWYHAVVLIHPSEGMKMYIDNVKQVDTGWYFNATANCELDTYVGSYGLAPNRYFKGKIDDLIFYNRALTEAEIYELYQL